MRKTAHPKNSKCDMDLEMEDAKEYAPNSASNSARKMAVISYDKGENWNCHFKQKARKITNLLHFFGKLWVSYCVSSIVMGG